MSAVNHHRQLDFFGPSKIVERVHGRAGGAAAEEDIVHQHDRFTGHIKRNHRGMDFWSGALVEVVAVHRNVEDADGDRLGPDFRKDFAEPFGQMVATHRNTGQNHFCAVFIAFGNFMRNPGQRPLDGGGIKDDTGFRHGSQPSSSARPFS